MKWLIANFSVVVLFWVSVAYGSLNVVLLGAPGSGKGTVGAQLKTDLGIPHISTGDLIRAEVSQNTEFGRLVKAYADSGRVMEDQSQGAKMFMELLRTRLSQPDCQNGFILEGVSRTRVQAEQLDEVLESIHKKLDHVVMLEVSPSVLLDRLSEREICKPCGLSYHRKSKRSKEDGKCDQCGGGLYQRPDDRSEVVQTRLQLFDRENQAILQFYREKGILRSVNGEGSVDEVYQAVQRSLTVQAFLF